MSERENDKEKSSERENKWDGRELMEGTGGKAGWRSQCF